MHIELLTEADWQTAEHPAGVDGSLARPPSFASEGGVTLRGTQDCYALRIVLERIAISIFVMGDPINLEATDSSIARTIRSMKKIERQSDGSLRVHVFGSTLAERLGCALRQSASKDALGVHPRVARDRAIERLARALLSSGDLHGLFDETYANAVSVAIIARLITVHVDSLSRRRERPSTGLQQWRLQRVIDYVDAHLADAITLADMAQVAGLTRMHFARQFRIATGIRPHEFLLRRRIDIAQNLLRSSRAALAEIALSVGFRAQPHFTTIFKRIVGETPHRWRAAISDTQSVRRAR
jgi:AraC-like DNA-binding protein